MGQSPLEWGDFPFVHLSVCPSVHSPLWVILLSLRPSQPGLEPGWLVAPQALLDGPEDVRIYVHMYGRTENLPILQDFVLYWGRCPASPHANQENVISK